MTSARTLHPQDQIAHYRIVGPLGAGGMGEVYLAQDQTLERSVALKILPPELVQSEERVRRFVREAKSASSLNHPNIVTIYEIGQDEVRGSEGAKESGSSALHYISMELVSGETLTTKIHHDKTDLRTLLGYLAQAAEGLAKAHAAGIVHRDLKPGNIMVSKDGFAKVLDFGLAKLTEKAPADADVTSGPTHGDDTGVGAVVGTVGYMSPEQVRGASVDHRSDIFSFGCILYEAATRKKPFVADSNVETMHKILHDKPTPVEEINKDVPAEVRRLIRRCLAKNPEQRFQSAKDLAIELREVVDEYDDLSGSGSSGSGSSALAAPVATGRKGLSPAAIIAGSLLLAAILVTAGLLIRRGQDAGETVSDTPLRVSTVTNRGTARSAAISPDGRYQAYILSLDGMQSIRVHQIVTGSDVEVHPPVKTRIDGLAYSPDGSYLYYQSADPDRAGYTAVFEIPALGGAPRKRVYDVDSRVTFSPDGKQIAFRRGAPQKKQELLYVFDLERGQGRALATVDNPVAFGEAAWSPDGKEIAVIETNGRAALTSTVVTYRMADGKREAIGKNGWIKASSLAWLPDGSAILVSAFDAATAADQQIWRLDVPSGRLRRITNDQSQYSSLSVSADGSSLGAVRYRPAANLWTAAPFGARSVRQLTFGSGDEGAVKGFAAGKDSTIYFSMVKDGAAQVWAVGMSGGNPTRVTSRHQFAGFPRRAGDGVILLQADEDLVPHLWRVDADGERERQLTTGSGERGLDVSSDGKVVLFERFDQLDVLWSVSTEGGEPVRIGPGSRGSGLFSPDGKRIFHTLVRAVNGEGEFIEQIIAADGSGTPVPVGLPPRASEVRWSADGTALEYLDAANGFQNLYRLPLNGGKPSEVTRFAEGRVGTHVWSPDGKHLLLWRRVGSAANLWVCAADGSGARAITDFETGEISDQHWSADGSRVIFTYGESTQNAVLIRNFR